MKALSPKKPPKKGFVTIVTNMGNLNLQLHCDLVPLACENFLGLCENGFYKNTIFHRNIRHFMIQGGDPTSTGKGGKSIWGKEFPDEFMKNLKHDGAGVLSMANYGKNTNTSQFFICYKSAPHLNNKHTVFGKLVGGIDVLKALALIETDPTNDKPLIDIMILDTIVYLNPFSKEEMEKEQLDEKLKKDKEKEKQEFGQWLSNPQPLLVPGPADTTKGVGKYLSKTVTIPTQKRQFDFGEITQQTTSSKKQKTGYGEFSQFGMQKSK